MSKYISIKYIYAILTRMKEYFHHSMSCVSNLTTAPRHNQIDNQITHKLNEHKSELKDSANAGSREDKCQI